MRSLQDGAASTPPATAAPAPAAGVAPKPSAPEGQLVGFRGVVVYAGGRDPEQFEAGPAIISRWEEYALRNGYPPSGAAVPGMLMSQVIAFNALGYGPEGFETWRADVYAITVEPFDIPPTRLAPTAA